VQVCPCAKHRGGIGLWPALAYQPRIPRAGGITGAGEQAARLLQAQAFDDLPAQAPNDELCSNNMR